MTKTLHCSCFGDVYVNIILILALQFFCCLLKSTQEVSIEFLEFLTKQEDASHKLSVNSYSFAKQQKAIKESEKVVN